MSGRSAGGSIVIHIKFRGAGGPAGGIHKSSGARFSIWPSMIFIVYTFHTVTESVKHLLVAGDQIVQHQGPFRVLLVEAIAMASCVKGRFETSETRLAYLTPHSG